ncbi:MAG TPA: aminotransferase class III-fold pyridoxal phosphate-dependent enzyme [Sphingobium sp.]|uniref:aspartate aminotransferase family protein n=1 Tax=Sphingobium sp. TaxID=1912891 RepID=UPI002ECFDF94
MGLDYQTAVENFSKVFSLSKQETESGTSFIPGGFSRKTFNYGPHAVFAERGEGQYLYTIDGQKLLDLNNNFSVNVIGQNHPAVNAAIQNMLETGFSFGNPVKQELALAKLLCDRIASVERVKFFCSASEACLGAVRIARGYTGRDKIAKFEGGYHGFTDDLSVSVHPSPEEGGPAAHPFATPDSGGIPSYKTRNVVVLVQNDFAACEAVIRENAADLACLMMELQAGAGGMVVLEEEFVRKIEALCLELDILLIVDETMSLRAAPGGLQSLYKVKPDLTVMGKMIGGGLPIGAVGGSAKIFDVVEKDKVTMSGTHHGNPMACAAGIALMNVMDNAAYDRLNAMAERIKTDLNDWAAERGIPFIVFGRYSILGYVFTMEPGQTIDTHRDYWTKVDGDKMMIYALEMATRGYFPVHRGQIGLTLPMTDEDIGGYIAETKDIIARIYS